PTAFTTEALGIELDGAFTWDEFTLSFIATLQDTEITDSTELTDVGNQVLRQPEWQFRLSPSYTFETLNFDLTFYAAASFISDRWGDNANTVRLDSYEKIDLGVTARFGDGLFLQIGRAACRERVLQAEGRVGV